MSESFSSAITSQRSYGATRSNQQNVMLTVIDSRLITHKLEPSDTLQGLAIKYGVTVERLKRINKLWSDESIHIKDSLQIPCSSPNDYNQSVVPCTSAGDFNKHEHYNSAEDELNSSCKENQEKLADQKEIPTKESDDFKLFHAMLTKIDGQIETHKHKNQQTPEDLPVVGYDSYQSLSADTSPVKQNSFLEQGI